MFGHAGSIAVSKWKTKKAKARTAEARSRSFAFVWLLMGLHLSGAGHAGERILTCSDEETFIDIPAGETATVLRIEPDNAPVWLALEEVGRDLEWRIQHDVAYTPISSRPPRLGLAMVSVPLSASVALRATGLNTRNASLKARLLCGANAAQEEFARCLEFASQPESSPGSISHFMTTTSAACRGFIAHSAAAAAISRDDTRAGKVLYETAASAWRGAGDFARLSAAELGLSERLYDLGDFDRALPIIESAIENGRKGEVPYFVARAESLRCMIIDQIRPDADYEGCNRHLPKSLVALGEVSESAGILYNLAFDALEDGKDALASRRLQKALSYPADQVTPMMRGRLHFLDSRLHLKNGRIDRAFASLADASDAFETASSPYWLANVHLQAARIYGRLASPAESSIFLARAEDYFTPAEAAHRQLAVAEMKAELAGAAGQLESAAAIAAQTARRYADLGMREQSADAWLSAIRFGDKNGWQALDALQFDAIASDRQRVEMALMRVITDVRSAEVPATGTQSVLDRLATQATSLDQLLHVHEWQVRDLLRTGETNRAFELVDAVLRKQLAMIDDISLPALRYLSTRRLRTLSGLWVDAYVAQAPDHRMPVEQVRARLSRLYALSALVPTRAEQARPSAQLDNLLAEAMLPQEAGSRTALLEAQRSLLDYYASSAGRSTSHFALTSTSTIPDAPLPANVVRLSYAVGEQRAFVVASHGSQSVIHEIGHPEQIRGSARRLVSAVHRRETPTGEIHAIAAELSRLIFPEALPDVAPLGLRIEPDESLLAVPFALLVWPDASEPLLETTAVSIQVGTEHSAAMSPPAIDVLLAARPTAHLQVGLPMLHGADVEPELIAAIFPDRTIRVHAGREGTRARLEKTLVNQGAWLHVAAHGVSRNGLQGLAGLWLTSTERTDRPDFVSWLGLVDRPLSAALVVLNACQLADTGDAAMVASASFATALAMAGVDHVIAAQWQVSDNASSVWVPAFYETLRADVDKRPAAALRHAQLALRRSRVFRHPFYWAGLIHLTGR